MSGDPTRRGRLSQLGAWLAFVGAVCGSLWCLPIPVVWLWNLIGPLAILSAEASGQVAEGIAGSAAGIVIMTASLLIPQQQRLMAIAIGIIVCALALWLDIVQAPGAGCRTAFLVALGWLLVAAFYMSRRK